MKERKWREKCDEMEEQEVASGFTSRFQLRMTERRPCCVRKSDNIKKRGRWVKGLEERKSGEKRDHTEMKEQKKWGRI